MLAVFLLLPIIGIFLSTTLDSSNADNGCETHGDQQRPIDPVEGRTLLLYNSYTATYLTYSTGEDEPSIRKVTSLADAKPWQFLKISGEGPGGRQYHISTLNGRFCLEGGADSAVYLSACRMNDTSLQWFYFMHLECEIYDVVLMNTNTSGLLDVNPAGYRSPVSAIDIAAHYTNGNEKFQHWKTISYPPGPKMNNSCESHGDRRWPTDPLEARILLLYNSQTATYLTYSDNKTQAIIRKVQSMEDAKPWQFFKISGHTPGGRQYHISTLDARFCLAAGEDSAVYMTACRMNDTSLQWFYFTHLECDIYDAALMNTNTSGLLDINPAGYRSPVSAIDIGSHDKNGNAQYQHWKTISYPVTSSLTTPSQTSPTSQSRLTTTTEMLAPAVKSERELSTAEFIGIAVGCIVLIAIVMLCVACLVCARRKQKPESSLEHHDLALKQMSITCNPYEAIAPGSAIKPVKDDAINSADLELVETKRLLEMIWPDVVRDAALKTGVVPNSGSLQVSELLKGFELADSEQLDIGEQLGRGNFSIVNSAILRSTGLLVAVKQPRVHQLDNYSSLIAEAVVMSKLDGHQNILRLIGAQTARMRKLCLITELCRYGALDRFLRKAAPSFNSRTSLSSDDESGEANCTRCGEANEHCECYPRPRINLAHLAWFSYQIAKGLDYLCSKGVIHRDIAARNVLVSDSLILKISDFGLSRNLPEYIVNCSQMPPVQWLADECLNEGCFTVKSDVYSFGVVVWEIYSLGQAPPKLPLGRSLEGETAIKAQFQKPDLAPEQVYELMIGCWNTEPSERPSFRSLKADMRKLGFVIHAKAFGRLMATLDGEDDNPIAMARQDSIASSLPEYC